MRFPSTALLTLLLAAPSRAADCSMTGYTDCVSTSNPERKAACVPGLQAIREACNGKADEAQAKMQELGSTTNGAAKPEMASYMTALNNLFEISRAAQQLSYNDPKALELLKGVNQDTGAQQYNMNRTFEVVAKIEKESADLAKGAVKVTGKKTGNPKTAPKGGPKRGAPRRMQEGSSGSPGGSAGGTGGGGGGGGDDGGTTSAAANDDDAGAAADAAAAERAQAGGAKAMGSARALGDALKRDLNVDAGAAPGAGKAAPGGRPGFGGGNAGGSAASPKTEKDLMLASVSGFGGSLTALGLKTGKDANGGPTILRMDGSPATEADLVALKARISGEPTALMRRPDFYSAIPRQRFIELKNDYRGRPELQDGPFRHVGLSESERDFQRSASCSSLAGPCAPHAKSASYKKGEDVPPEELASIHRAVRDEPESDFIDEGPESGFDGPPDETKAASTEPEEETPAPPEAPRGMKALLAKLETLLALQPATEAVTGVPAGSPAARRQSPASTVPGLDAARALGARLPPGRYLAGGALLAVALALLLRRRAT